MKQPDPSRDDHADAGAERRWRFETAAIHGKHLDVDRSGAVITPVYLTSTFAKGNDGQFDYSRSSSPNFRALEAVLASLEATRHATVFASGVSAITAVVSSLAAGDLILAEENLYGCTYRLFEQVFRKFGVTAQYLDFTAPESLEAIKAQRPALVWIESPTNPLMKVLDIAAIAKVCNAAGSPLVVDNTFASPYVQRPVALGATLSLSSTTKYINGHSDSLGGVVCTDDEAWQQKMNFARKALGLHPAPFDCWLIERGVKTLAVRMQQHKANALALAQYLESAAAVRTVWYPYLDSHPQHSIARKQMTGGSGIVTVDLDLSFEATQRFLERLDLFTLAESLGGIESLVCHPASMTHASIPSQVRQAVGITDSLVRFSVGIEHIDDLIADVEQALAVVSAEAAYGGDS